MTKTFYPFVALILLAGLLTGCGGGSHPGTPVVRSGRATFVVHWPARTTRLIPIASNSIRVVITRNGTQVASQLLARPQDSNSTQATFDPLPVGDLVANASAFPNADGSGVAQATGSAALSITAGANTTINLTMGTTITSVVVAPSPNLVFGSTQNGSATVTASAMDANNNVVLTSGSTFTWSTSNPKIATVTPNGASALVVATGIGTASIAAVESESNVSGQAQATVRGQGLFVNIWSKFRSDARNTGVGTAALLGNTLNWSITTGGPVESSPAVAQDGTIYFGSGDGNVYALNPVDGSTKWTSFLGGHIKSSPIIASDGTVYAASTNGQIVALEKSDGSQKWNVSFGGSYASSPTLGPDGTLYIAGEDAVVRALDGATGNQVWQAGFSSAIESSPAISVDGSAIYLGAGDKKLHALRTTDGSEIWSFSTGGAIQSSPALDTQSNVLYFGSDDGRIYAVNANDGSSHWQTPFATGGIVSSSPAIGTARVTGSAIGIFVGSTDGKFYALDAATGSSLAQPFQARGSIRSSPAVSRDGTIVFGSDDGTVYYLQLNGGALNPQANFQTGAGVNSSPALATFSTNGTVYIGSTDSKLYSLINGG